MRDYDRVMEEVRLLRSLPPPEERRAIREAAQQSRDAVGRAIGISGAAIAGYEAGTRTPRGEHLRQYASLLTALRREIAMAGDVA